MWGRRQPAPVRLNIHRKDVNRRVAWLCNDDGTNKAAETSTVAYGQSSNSKLTKLNEFGRRSFGEKIILAARARLCYHLFFPEIYGDNSKSLFHS